MDDLYKILGVPSSASADEIKKAYREAAFKYHPDRNAGDSVAEDKFKKISAAYSVLGDETKRAEYDRYGSTDEYAPSYTRQYGQTGQAYAHDPFGADFWTWYEQAMHAKRNKTRRFSALYTFGSYLCGRSYIFTLFVDTAAVRPYFMLSCRSKRFYRRASFNTYFAFTENKINGLSFSKNNSSSI